jgi:hypothetical protein
MSATSRYSSWTSAGYAPLAERVLPAGFNDLVQRCFGGFFDRIKDAGGDVNGPAGDLAAQAVRTVEVALMRLGLAGLDQFIRATCKPGWVGGRYSVQERR